jgi:hypothetical protein
MLLVSSIFNHLVFEEFHNAQRVDVDAMAGAGVRQEDVLEEGQLLRQQLDPLLQLLVLLQMANHLV